MIELSIIVVSYNTVKLLENCLSSLEKALKLSNLVSTSEIIMVDNASRDGSVIMVTKRFPKVQVIKNIKNEGFGSANNKGILKTRGKYVLLLNSDTVVNSEALKQNLSTLKNNQNIGVIGCKLLNKDNTVEQSCGFFPTLFRVFSWMFFIDDIPFINKILKPYHITNKAFYNNNHIKEVDWVTGAYFLARKEALIEAGLFDRQVFMYMEEIDLCYRVKQHEWKIVYTPAVSIIHLKGGSGIGKNSGIIEEFNGLKYYYGRYYGRISQSIVDLLLRLGALLRVTVFGIIRDSEKKHIYLRYLKLVG